MYKLLNLGGKEMLVKPQANSGHWYEKNGKPAYTVKGKTGVRATTLRDARKLDLVPSVTTVLNLLAKPGLDNWKQEQVLLSALTLPRILGETEDSWITRVIADSRESTKKAAERGTAIHNVIEAHYEQVYNPEPPPYLRNIENVLYDEYGAKLWIAEKSFAHELGYGGKVDLSTLGIVVDFKTKESSLDKAETYFEHHLQLAAYRVGLGMPDAKCAICFVNGTTNEVKLCPIDEEELDNAWEVFKALLQVWKIKNKI